MTTIIDSLVLEHAVYGHLFNQIEKQLPRLNTLDEAKLLGNLMEGLLAGHGDREENLAYAALDQALAERNELDSLYEDHDELDGRLDRLKTTGALPEARRLLKEVIQAMRQHFKREELLIFPKLKAALNEETLAELSEAWLKWDAVKPKISARKPPVSQPAPHKAIAFLAATQS